MMGHVYVHACAIRRAKSIVSQLAVSAAWAR
jgi:hypothetical protein